MDCSPPGSSVHGILQVKILEWVAVPSYKDFLDLGIELTSACISCIAGEFFIYCVTREALLSPELRPNSMVQAHAVMPSPVMVHLTGTCCAFWSNFRCSWLPYLPVQNDAKILQFPVSPSLLYLFFSYQVFAFCTHCLKFRVHVYTLFLSPFSSLIWLVLPLISTAYLTEDPLKEGMVTHSSILAWRIPWTEDPCGPRALAQSIGLQRVRHELKQFSIHVHKEKQENHLLSTNQLLLIYSLGQQGEW